jgi:hypothetical protein
MVLAAFAEEHPLQSPETETVRAGGPTIKVERVRITDCRLHPG